MSRFKGTYRPAPAATAVAAPPRPNPLPSPVVPPAPVAQPLHAASAPPAGLAHRLGFFVLCVYLLAGVVNGAVFRVSGNTTFLTTACLAALPLLMLADGTLLASIQENVGRLWALFAIWLILGVPGSLWRGGSFTLLSAYLPRSLMPYFFITSFLVSLTENRLLMNINIFASVLVVLNCVAFGTMQGGRLEIPRSLFFENANDLGLALLLGVCQTAYLFCRPSVRAKIWGGVVAFGLLYYMMKTGSRGCLLALLPVGFVAFLLSRQKVVFAVAAVLGLIMVLLATPDQLRRRLTSIVSDPATAAFASEDEIASYGSQLQREQLLRQSVQLTLRHPLFGVGPGQFAGAVFEDATREGKRANWMGTHNSYTEVSSECGLPALFLYLAIIFWTLRTSWRIYRWSAGRTGLNAVEGLSFSLLLGTIAFASATFFFHVAYTGYLPILSGSVAALWNATGRGGSRALVAAPAV
jgi:O-antigen ligase